MPGAFARRHIGPTPAEITEMLATLGYESLDELVTAAMPAEIRDPAGLELPTALSETAAAARLRELSERNHPGRAMIGMGYYGTITPAVIRRNVLENPTWYTAYTPYQPEISQGRLEALLVFQTMVSDLTALPVAGASLLDEGTAAAEAMALAHRVKRRPRVLVDEAVFPQTLAVLRTRARTLGIELECGALELAQLDTEVAAVIVQTPDADGRLQETAALRQLAERVHAQGGLVIAAADLLALTLVTAPGEWGADIAVGSTQRFGVPLWGGGPSAGYIAVRSGLERQLPGRLVGVSVDADGDPALRLTLQTREQHIRREKATSNICTAQVLLAVTAALYAVYHGPQGLAEIAARIHEQARHLAGCLAAAGIQPRFETFFDTIVVPVPGRAAQIVAAAHAAGLQLRLRDADSVGISIGEDVTTSDLEALLRIFGVDVTPALYGRLSDRRTSAYLSHPVFNTYTSETQMMRYLHALASRDFALDQGMIPLGSCTMKLSAAAEMEAISLPGFANLHPFAPAEDQAGNQELIDELGRWLCEITGYQAVSFQPNAGSQGEYTGLVAVRRYHESRGEGDRNICLIPSSAHGTNAASAALAGFEVVVVGAAPDGSIDLDDLSAKIAQYQDRIGVAMITYPSTHGAFEGTAKQLSEQVHAAGGLVYIDGANLNALVGLAKPGHFGGDVSHLNLHKTFAIPHGGGGPGVGPVLVGERLAPFLPTHPHWGVLADTDDVVSASPYGSVGMLPISYAYIAMLGPDGLKQASQVALLNANYIAHRLQGAYEVLYTGQNGRVAHECILDLRPLSAATGVSVDDVAKRLIDYGFHAPTMSFPVAGTLMVEPTESEDKGELDRFCDAMLAIRAEIEQVSAGVWPVDDNPLCNAPHPLKRVSADQWEHPYARSLGAFPAGARNGLVEANGSDKYWAPVGRIDNAHGDRHLVLRLA